VGGSGCRGEGGDREGGLTGGGGEWEALVFEEGEAWPAGGSVSRRGRHSGCRPTTASGRGGAGRPRGAQGGVSLLRRCSHAGESMTPWHRHAAARRAGEEGAGRRQLEHVGGLKGDAVLEFGAATARTPGSGGAGLRRVLAAHAMARWALGGPGDRAWSGLGRKQELGRAAPRENEGD
jgi:hypothetical protein